MQVEDTLLGKQRRIPVDMVVLMGAIEPRRDARETGLKVGISCSMAGLVHRAARRSSTRWPR